MTTFVTNKFRTAVIYNRDSQSVAREISLGGILNKNTSSFKPLFSGLLDAKNTFKNTSKNTP